VLSAVLAACAVVALAARFRPAAPVRRVGNRAAHTRPARRLPGVPRRLLHRRSTLDPAELAVWCDSLSRALRAGSTLHQCLRTVAPPTAAARQLEPALLALERGASVSSALAALDVSSPHLDLAVVVLRACAEHGGAAAEPIDRAAAALRQRAALDGERRTHSAQARMSATVMTLLPGAMLALLLATSASVRSAVAQPGGLAAVALGTALNAAGWWWMRRTIEGSRR
jgi:tight adherence protein B